MNMDHPVREQSCFRRRRAGGSNSELRLKRQLWRTTLESPELRERSWREARGAAGIRRRSAPRPSLGAISANASQPSFESIDQFLGFSLFRLEDRSRFIESRLPGTARAAD
jgi:hypothetical protein